LGILCYETQMNSIRHRLQSWLEGLVKRLPGLIVLAVVLMLLRGPFGTIEAIRLQLTTLIGSFLGPGDGLGAVVLHTLPLAVAAAVATFLMARRILTFQSFASVVGLSLIIITGAAIGGLARGLTSEITVVAKDVDPQLPLATAIQPPAIELEFTETIRLHPDALRELETEPIGVQPSTRIVGDPAVPAAIPVAKSPTAVDQLREVNWLAEPQLANIPSGKVDPLHILPEPGGVIGLVTRSINQLLGYLVAYQPRLFLAAIIAGAWMGWSVHQRLGTLERQLREAEATTSAPEITPRRRAA
jgi:hypothetical protein